MPTFFSPRGCPVFSTSSMYPQTWFLGPWVFASLLFGSVLVPASTAAAQDPSQMLNAPTPAVQLPLLGPPSQGSVFTTQSTTSSSDGSSVDASNSTINIQGSYNGSTPHGKANSQILPLTLANALKLGLRFNLAAIGEANSVLQAKGQRKDALSALLPSFNTAVSEQFEQLNLRTEGVETDEFPLTARFNYFDARAIRLDQSVLDVVRLDNLHSASASLSASLKSAYNARDLIVLAVGGSYLQLIAAGARVDAAAAQVASSQAIYKQAADRFAAGLNAQIDALRAQVQLQTEQQRLRSLQADLDTQKLRLARLIGLPLAQNFAPADTYPFSPVVDFTLDTALQRAYQNRTDLQAAAAEVKAATESVKAAHAERLPHLNLNADVGAAGLTPSHESSGVFTIAGTLAIPLYEGGRIQGDIEQATAALRQRKAELEDLRGQVDEDIRQAFIDLNSAADQVRVASSNVTLAHQTLTQSLDRFNAGVADSVELVQSEQAVVQADNDYIDAVFEHNLAKVSLARAMGNAEQVLPQLLRK